MNIQDYALDIGKSVEDVLAKMATLKLITTDSNRLLSDDEVILLDNAFQDEEDYVPSEDVRSEISENSNIVDKAIEGLGSRRADIERQINQNSYGDEDGISSGIDKSTAATLEARKSYLETLVPTN